MKVKYRLLKLVQAITRNSIIPKNLRFRLANLLFPPNQDNSYSFCVDFYGLKYNGNISNYIDWSVFFFGAYEQEDLEACSALLKKLKKVQGILYFYDIGANVGHHALFASTIVDKVFAFEPFSLVRLQLIEKIQLNKVDNIKVIPLGLGDVNSNMTFIPPDSSNLGTGFFNVRGDSDDSNTGGITLEVVQGDAYIEANKLDPPNFIKMDIEGFEPLALLGLRKTLEAYRPILMIELSEKSAEYIKTLSKSSIFDFLPLDYVAYLNFDHQLKPADINFNGKNYFFLPKEFPLT